MRPKFKVRVSPFPTTTTITLSTVLGAEQVDFKCPLNRVLHMGPLPSIPSAGSRLLLSRRDRNAGGAFQVSLTWSPENWGT